MLCRTGDYFLRYYCFAVCLFQILDPTETQPLTFLYKLDMGRCSKSHGFHAAKMAGVGDDVIELAQRMAGDMEERQRSFLEFRKVFAM